MPAKPKSPFAYLIALVFICLVLLLSFLNLNLFFKPITSSVLGEQTDLQQQIVFWEKKVQENPSYLDGWLELIKLYQETENNAQAKKALNQALKINPNSEKVIFWEEKLKGN